MESEIPQMVDHFAIIISVILAHTAAILGLYVWTYSSNKTHTTEVALQLGKMYACINKHMQEAPIHIRGEEKFVTIATCEAVHTNLRNDVTEIKADVKTLIASRFSG